MPNTLEEIYERCQQRPQTKITKHILASKLLEILEYFDERNSGLQQSNQAFISEYDTIEMIMRNPRIITSSINNNIIAKCQVITDKKGSVRDANMLIKSNPGIFRKTTRSIIEGK